MKYLSGLPVMPLKALPLIQHSPDSSANTQHTLRYEHLWRWVKTDNCGGDKSAILFPETGQPEAEVVMYRVHGHLTGQMRQKYSLVSFRAIAVTCAAVPNSTEETIKIADDLMCSVKNGTKNGIRYFLYIG